MQTFLIVYFAAAVMWSIGTLVWGWIAYKAGYRNGRTRRYLKPGQVWVAWKHEPTVKERSAVGWD